MPVIINEISKLTAKGKMDEAARFEKRSSCCTLTWAVRDCVEKDIKECEKDKDKIKKNIQYTINFVEKNECKDFEYHSKECGPNCMEKFQNEIAPLCNKAATAKLANATEEMNQAKAKGDVGYFLDRQEYVKCCTRGFTINCFEQNILRQCTVEEFNDMHKQFETERRNTDNTDCQHYPVNLDKCDLFF